MKKILHFSGTYLGDGASFSVINLNNYLNTNKIKSNFFLLKKEEHKIKNIFSLNSTFWAKFNYFFLAKFETMLLRFYKKNRNFAFFNNFVESNTLQIIDKENPDIVHFHWLPRLFNFHKIVKIKNKIIITLRDYWLITGGCNYPVNCSKYTSNCNLCPHLNHFYMNKDLSYFNFKNKRSIISKIKDKINVVVLNTDMKNEVTNLNIFNKKNIFLIPNGIEQKEFYITNVNKERIDLNINTSKKIILFGAQNLDQPWKGLETIFQLSKILDKNKYLLMSFGEISKTAKKKLEQNLEYIDLGYIKNNSKLRSVYNAADFFLFPSQIETFGKVILESIFCGTPVIAFNKYAAKDIITHRIDGYLANINDINDMHKGISYMSNKSRIETIKECKKKIKLYNMKEISKKYLSLYNNL
jgi:glycosyltransferase involved in cell wall biosynthesis